MTDRSKPSDRVPIAASYDRAQAFLFNSGLFGGTFTEAVTRTVKLGLKERDVVELCGEYLDLLKQEAAS